MAKKPKPADAAKPKVCSILPDTVLGDDVALVAENMERILSSPSYSLAQEDPALLQRVEMRGVRMLLELGKPELALQADNIESTEHEAPRVLPLLRRRPRVRPHRVDRQPMR
jgi:hypothetical protein